MIQRAVTSNKVRSLLQTQSQTTKQSLVLEMIRYWSISLLKLTIVMLSRRTKLLACTPLLSASRLGFKMAYLHSFTWLLLSSIADGRIICILDKTGPSSPCLSSSSARLPLHKDPRWALTSARPRKLLSRSSRLSNDPQRSTHSPHQTKILPVRLLLEQLSSKTFGSATRLV